MNTNNIHTSKVIYYGIIKNNGKIRHENARSKLKENFDYKKEEPTLRKIISKSDCYT